MFVSLRDLNLALNKHQDYKREGAVRSITKKGQEGSYSAGDAAVSWLMATLSLRAGWGVDANSSIASRS